MTAGEFIKHKNEYPLRNGDVLDFTLDDLVLWLNEYSQLQNQTIIAKYLGEKEHNAHLTGRIKELEDKYETQIGHLSAENSDLANQIEGLCNGSKKLRETVKELEAENVRYRDRIGEALKFLQSRQQTTPGLGAPVTILKQALEK